MKPVQHKALVFAIALASLAGCRTADMERDTDRTSAQSTTYSSPGQQMDEQTGMTAGTATGEDAQRSMDAAQPNAVVMNIETVSRSSMMGGTAGTSGTSGTAGTTGTSESDRLYRITVRMDDGSSRTLMQERAPSFRPGDRVTVSNDMVIEQ